MNLPAILPESFLRCMTPDSRKLYASGQHTAEECLARGQAKNERQLQTMIVNLLRLKGIEPLWHRTDKRSAATIGWPDLSFAVKARDPVEGIDTWIEAHGWEVKFGNGQLSKEQQQMHVRLSTPPNCWRIKIIRSVDEALAELKELGL